MVLYYTVNMLTLVVLYMCLFFLSTICLSLSLSLSLAPFLSLSLLLSLSLVLVYPLCLSDHSFSLPCSGSLVRNLLLLPAVSFPIIYFFCLLFIYFWFSFACFCKIITTPSKLNSCVHLSFHHNKVDAFH